jgi:hypothetical protein
MKKSVLTQDLLIINLSFKLPVCSLQTPKNISSNSSFVQRFFGLNAVGETSRQCG